jgi:hypothetical protein
MKTVKKGMNIDEVCKDERGTFKKFVAKKTAHLKALETERKDRIRASREAAQELSLAA